MCSYDDTDIVQYVAFTIDQRQTTSSRRVSLLRIHLPDQTASQSLAGLHVVRIEVGIRTTTAPTMIMTTTMIMRTSLRRISSQIGSEVQMHTNACPSLERRSPLHECARRSCNLPAWVHWLNCFDSTSLRDSQQHAHGSRSQVRMKRLIAPPAMRGH